MTPADGGAAFPATIRNYDDSLSGFAQPGMSLRDYFAGQALIGLLASTVEQELCDEPRDYAITAYSFADAMLSARGRGT